MPGFWILGTPATVLVNQGASSSTTINVTDAGGFSGNVTLAVTTPLPSGVTASWGNESDVREQCADSHGEQFSGQLKHHADHHRHVRKPEGNYQHYGSSSCGRLSSFRFAEQPGAEPGRFRNIDRLPSTLNMDLTAT